MKRTLPWLLALLLITGGAWGSRRGQEPRVTVDLPAREVFTGEVYGLTLHSHADGFVYLYSLDSDGYVTLLYPVLDADGRGQLRAGDSLTLQPLYAGSVPGFEQLVAVHTREFRPIRASRRHFLAPDPQDLPDIHARLTRSERELDNYATATLSVLAASLPGSGELADRDDEGEEDGDAAGLVIHHHVYDYWCPYCDCWHPTCDGHHCWCGWEVVDHYWGSYHYSHCFFWGAWHPWWRPPVIYVYVRGGSPWDYDTRPWRPRHVWGARRHDSERWRQAETPRIADPEPWTRPRQRSAADTPDWVDLRKRLEPAPAAPQPSVLSTEQPPDKDSGAPGTWSTRPRDEGGDLKPAPPAAKEEAAPLWRLSRKAKGGDSAPAGKKAKAGKPGKAPKSDKQEEKPDKPEQPAKPDKPEKPDKPKPEKPAKT